MHQRARPSMPLYTMHTRTSVLHALLATVGCMPRPRISAWQPSHSPTFRWETNNFTSSTSISSAFSSGGMYVLRHVARGTGSQQMGRATGRQQVGRARGGSYSTPISTGRQ